MVVVVGAERFDNGQSDEGRAYVYHGSPAGLMAGPDWTAEGDQGWAHFGISVATAGDVNGDGYADVIVGADRNDIAGTDTGRIYVFYGGSSPDVIARVLEKRYLSGDAVNANHKTQYSLMGEKCPECGQTVSFEEGCILCHFCGFNKCG